MKLASFRDGELQTWGLQQAQAVRLASPALLARHPTLRHLLANGNVADVSSLLVGESVRDPDTLQFDPLIPAPAHIICVGVNYLEHIHEMGREKPDYPTLFTRFPESLVGHGQPLIRPRLSFSYDYEGELAIVIGRAGRYIAAADALTHVAGYTCFLDGSVRDWQQHTSQFIPGKNFPSSGSCGPWLTTTDEIPDPSRLRLHTRVNGEVLQNAPTGDLCFNVPAIIEYVSSFCALQPGDIIATGTPSGVGYARKPQRWLKPGDVVEVEISGIGILRNTVVDEN